MSTDVVFEAVVITLGAVTATLSALVIFSY